MPIGGAIVGAAVIGGGATYLSGKSAAKKAANASNYAADQNAQVSREIYQQTRSDLAPYNQAGQGALSALMVRMGLSPIPATGPGSNLAQPAPQAAGGPPKMVGGFAGTSPLEGSPVAGKDAAREVGQPQPAPIAPTAVPSAAPAAASAPTTGGGVDYAKLFADRPDVKAEYDKIAAVADPNSPWFAQHGLDRGAEGFADYWLANKPANDTYQAPTLAATPQAPTASDPNAPPPQYYEETYAQRPADVPIPTYQRRPDLSAPALPSVDWQSIANDPGFKFETDQAGSGVNARFAAAGKVRSGDAAKALQDRLFGVAHSYGQDYVGRSLNLYDRAADQYRYGQDRQDRNFVDDRSYGTNLAWQQQGRNDNIFSEDRGFTAGRNDQATANLFGLVGAGQNAAAGTANAGNVFASNVINSNNQRASTTANAAIANAQNVSNLFGSAANAVGTYYGMRGTGSSFPRQYNI
jgi:hypothetical protein